MRKKTILISILVGLPLMFTLHARMTDQTEEITPLPPVETDVIIPGTPPATPTPPSLHATDVPTPASISDMSAENGVPDANLIEVTFGLNNMLYAYHTERNECHASYRGNGTILEYSWQSADWEVSKSVTSSNSIVYLRALHAPTTSMANIVIRARNSAGWSQAILLGAPVNNDSSMAASPIQSSGSSLVCAAQ